MLVAHSISHQHIRYAHQALTKILTEIEEEVED